VILRQHPLPIAVIAFALLTIAGTLRPWTHVDVPSEIAESVSTTGIEYDRGLVIAVLAAELALLGVLRVRGLNMALYALTTVPCAVAAVAIVVWFDQSEIGDTYLAFLIDPAPEVEAGGGFVMSSAGAFGALVALLVDVGAHWREVRIAELLAPAGTAAAPSAGGGNPAPDRRQ
jgi:hypothetical protein